MRILTFDTETGGFPEQGGTLLQLAAHVCDTRFSPPRVVQEFSTLVKTGGADIHPGALAVHGITAEMAETGIAAKAACMWLAGSITKCDLIVAHNAAFDIKVMDHEFRRAGMEGFSPPPENVFCTMKASTDICQIPGQWAGKWKFPKLDEALRIMCDHELVGAHDALADTRGCHMVFLELMKRGLVPQLK